MKEIGGTLLNEKWITSNLSELVEKIGSGITPTGGSKIYKESGRKFIRSQNVHNGYLNLDDVVYIDEETHQKFNGTEIKLNDVFLNITGASIGRSCLATNLVVGGNVNQHVCIIRSEKDKLNSFYLNQFLISNIGQKQIDSFQAGGNREGLNFGQIKNLTIPLPPTLAAQEAIAEVLSDTDALITSLETTIQKKKLLKQGAMQELLTGKRRLPGFGGKGGMKDTEVGRIPEDWEVKKLGDVALFRRGSFPQPYGLSKWYDDLSGLPFVQVYDVSKNKKLKNETNRRISREAEKYSVFAEKGTVILTIQGSIGRIAVTQYDAYIDRTLLIFQEFKVQFDKYFFMLLIHVLFDKEKENAPGGIIKTITKESLSSFKIGYPTSTTEQEAIATVLSEMDEEIEGLEKKLEKTKGIKQGLMQVLLTGKVRLV